jgi:hypothetical protein
MAPCTTPRSCAHHPETDGIVRGQAALRLWWADSFGRVPGLRDEARRVTLAGDRLFFEYDRSLPGGATLAVAESFLARGGLIVESSVYHG